jgi:hypothetical protein
MTQARIYLTPRHRELKRLEYERLKKLMVPLVRRLAKYEPDEALKLLNAYQRSVGDKP